MNVLALVFAMSLVFAPAKETKQIQWASPIQGEAFCYGPYPQCASGGWGSGKTHAYALKAIWLSTEYPKNRGVIARHVGKELRETTMASFYKICPPHLYDKRKGGRRNDQNGYLKLAESQSEILFMHLEDPDTQGIIRGLEINWFFIDQAEENPDHMEEIFDLLCGRLGRWDVAEVPQWRIDADFAATGKPWPFIHAESGKPVPPPYPLLAVNPDVETHWVYRRFHPESLEYHAKYKALGYRMFHMPSEENRFLGETNRKFLLQHDDAFIRRNVKGLWGMPEGAIHTIHPSSLIPGSPELLQYFREHCTLYRTMDYGDSAPTCVVWWAVDRDANVFCISPETRVLTEDLRYVPAGDVRVGDRLQAFDETASARERRQHRVATVESVEHVHKPSYRLSLSDGTMVVCSADHLWLCRRGEGSNFKWMRTDELHAAGEWRCGSGPPSRHGSRIVKLFDTWDSSATYDAGYMAGFLDGEGSFYKDTVSFGQNRGVVLDRVLGILREWNIHFYEQETTAPSGAQFVNVSVSRRADVAKLLGMARPLRLLAKASIVGQVYVTDEARVVGIEPIGSTEVVAIQTSTGTFIAEGLASHNCYREYYQPNALISTHRGNIAGLSQYERYEQDLADPSIFHQMPAKQGGRFCIADEYADCVDQPRDTAIFWQAADNNELGTRNRINEYLRFDADRIHPITRTRGSARLFFVTANDSYPQGVYHVLRETRAQRRVKIGTDLGRPIFSDERDPDIVDHAYDPERYFVASRPPAPPPGSVVIEGTFSGAQKLARQHRLRMAPRR